MCLQSCTSSGEGAESVHTWVGTGSAFLWWRSVSGWRRGCGMDTSMDRDTRLLPGREGEGWRPPILGLSLGKRLVRPGLSALSKLASTSTCLGLRVLGTCTLCGAGPISLAPEE